jgi:glycosyltransferase involved in cell wall biosynthesis
MFLDTYIQPFLMADLILAHNELTLQSLRSFGVAPDRLKKIIHPVQVFADPPEPSHELTERLHRQQGDIIYCTVGFLHRYKGILAAVKALKFLPGNYKLAVLGGMKADSDDIGFYDKLCDLIDQLGLHERVYLTGYIKDHDRLNALIQECDVCVYAYDKVYYASVSSGSFNLAFANGMPVVAYPTESIKELAQDAEGAVVLTETFAYYELARSLRGIDLKKQAQLSKAYAEKMAWPKISRQLAEIYKSLI